MSYGRKGTTIRRIACGRMSYPCTTTYIYIPVGHTLCIGVYVCRVGG
nr:MAG TPA: hypothetical protein [Caudoviricetes sp.]